MGIPLYTVNSVEGAAYGAAILAAVGVGAWSDVSLACRHFVRRVDETLPVEASVEVYDRLFTVFRQVYSSLAVVNNDLSVFDNDYAN
jgi:xylulokinase